MLKRLCASLLVLLVALAAGVISADEPGDASVTLQAGYNTVTWSGAEPYAIANFEDTPITKIHRFDPVRQRWLGRIVGQDDGTLPELHLLPRVQYLLVVDERYELTIPSPLADIDPRAKLRFPTEPDDPLRFEAYWPNEDSPLEDLVVLRGEDERLSVKAWVDRGKGDVSVWWMIDGRVNHAGLESDDVDLIPGKHDDGQLFAVDESGQVAVVRLPRVVKLPPLELPEMVYGVAFGGAWGNWPPINWQQEEELDWMAEAGLTFSRWDLGWNGLEQIPGVIDNYHLPLRELWMSRYAPRGMAVLPIVANWNPPWPTRQDLESSLDTLTLVPGDFRHVQEHARWAARHWPEQIYWQVGNEPNLRKFWRGIDPWAFTDMLKAAALGIWYENPSAVVVSAGLCCFWTGEPVLPNHGEASSGYAFLRALYEADFGRWHDVGAVHYASVYHLDIVRSIMTENGDAEKPLWVTETGVSTRGGLGQTGTNGVTWSEQAAHLRERLQLYRDREDVRGVIIFKLSDRAGGSCPGDAPHCGAGLLEELPDGSLQPKPAYWAVREFITGKPPPQE